MRPLPQPKREVAQAVELMTDFASRTGVRGGRPARRYLWTDAFAVCNFLGLARATGDERHRDLALRVVDQVHHELGRHRPDERSRAGWISGLSEEDGEAHPTRGGLRIGKRLPERAKAEPFDADLEWDRDGQYFHYLTKWMHALDQTARSIGQSRVHVWARELAVAAHRSFTYGPAENRRMMWKLSIDLSRPLVPSMGHHDPLDGFVTCAELDATANDFRIAKAPSLAAASTDFAQMLDHEDLATSDPLGLGGLLFDAFRLAQVNASPDLIASLLEATVVGLRHYLAAPDLRAPAHRRLAFRELGLAIGLATVPMLEADPLARRLDVPLGERLAELSQYVPLRTEIESFWLDVDHRQTSTWMEHADINDVMLATSLVPDGFLVLASAQQTTSTAVASSSAP